MDIITPRDANDILEEHDLLAFLLREETLNRRDSVGAVARAVDAAGGLHALQSAAWHKRHVRDAIRRTRVAAKRYIAAMRREDDGD